jgi:hypothetical protein
LWLAKVTTTCQGEVEQQTAQAAEKDADYDAEEDTDWQVETGSKPGKRMRLISLARPRMDHNSWDSSMQRSLYQ